jgi:hypothetical protein
MNETTLKFAAFLERLRTERPFKEIESGLSTVIEGERAPIRGRWIYGFGPVLIASAWVPIQPVQPAPPPIVAAIQSWVDIDDAEWMNAVARQGVVLPRGGDYYLSTHWELLKAELVTGRCAMCARQIRTTLHHRLPCDTWGRERAADLTEICYDCHDAYHGMRRAA